MACHMLQSSMAAEIRISHAPEGDPTGNVISTPITEEEYAQILARA